MTRHIDGRVWANVSLHVGIPLAVAIAIYGVRHLGLAGDVPEWAAYSAADGLWLYALLSALSIIWGSSSSRTMRIFWLASGVTLAIIHELGQFFRVVSGTFDLADLAAYALAAVVAFAFQLHGPGGHFA